MLVWGSVPGEERQSQSAAQMSCASWGHSVWGREQHPSPTGLASGSQSQEQLRGVQCGLMVTLLTHLSLKEASCSPPQPLSQVVKVSNTPKCYQVFQPPLLSLVPCQKACQRRPNVFRGGTGEASVQ